MRREAMTKPDVGKQRATACSLKVKSRAYVTKLNKRLLPIMCKKNRKEWAGTGTINNCCIKKD